MKKYILPLLLVFVFSFFTIKPLFVSGFFPMHDDTQVQRVYEMWSSLKDGMFPVRWVSDLGYGYGYPIFNFYGPLAYYLGGLFTFVTGNALIATKLMFGTGILFAGVSMYLFVNTLAGRYAGIIAAVLYMYAPYHALNIYVRGDVAEFFAYAFLPLVFYGIHKYYNTQEKRFLAIGALGYAGVIISHNLSAMMLTPFIGGYLLHCMVLLRKNIKSALWMLLLPITGVLLTAFYWLPALGEMHYTNVQSVLGGGSDFRDHFVCLSQLWSSQWGYGGSIPGCIDGLSLQIGKVQILLFALGVSLCIWKKQIHGILLTVLGLLSIFFLLPYSQFIWESIQPMTFFQFPWRFLLPASFFFSAVGGIGIGLLLEKVSQKEWVLWSVTVLFSLAISIYSMKFFLPQTILSKSVQDYTSKQFLLWDTSKISDEYMPKGFQNPTADYTVIDKKLVAFHPDIEIKTLSQKAQYQKYEVKTFSPNVLHFNTAFFPAWHLYINGEEKVYTVRNNGLDFLLPKEGTYMVELRFSQTPLERVANTISLIGVFVLTLGIIKRRTYEKNH